MRLHATAVLTACWLSACLRTIPEYVEDRVSGSLDEDQRGLALVAINDGAPIVRLHLAGPSTFHLPDALEVRDMTDNLLGHDLEDPESLVGVAVEPTSGSAAERFRASADQQPGQAPPLELTLEGPGVTQASTSWSGAAGGQAITGTSVFTLYPDGKLVRTDTVTPQLITTPSSLTSYIAFAQGRFTSLQTSASTQMTLSTDPSMDTPLDAATWACLDGLTAPTFGIAWTLAGPTPGARRLEISAHDTFAFVFDWVTDAPIDGTTYSLTTVMVGSADTGDCDGVRSLLEASTTTAAHLELAQAANVSDTVPSDDGSYRFENLDGFGDVRVTAHGDTTEGFAIALDGERVRSVDVEGRFDEDKGPPLVQLHSKGDRIYVWIPAVLRDGQTLTLHLGS